MWLTAEVMEANLEGATLCIVFDVAGRRVTMDVKILTTNGQDTLSQLCRAMGIKKLSSDEQMIGKEIDLDVVSMRVKNPSLDEPIVAVDFRAAK